MCMYCKNDTLVESTTTHVVNYKTCTIIIKKRSMPGVQSMR